MRLSKNLRWICPLRCMLDFCVAQGRSGSEIGTGNWSFAPSAGRNCSAPETAAALDGFAARISPGNCSALPSRKDWGGDGENLPVWRSCWAWKKIVMMSGLPAGCPGDKGPVWITTSWPPGARTFWTGGTRLAIPSGAGPYGGGLRHPSRSRWKTTGCSWYTTRRPCSVCTGRWPIGRHESGPLHLFWMGGDPIKAAQVLGNRRSLPRHGKTPARAADGRAKRSPWTEAPSTSSAHVREITWRRLAAAPVVKSFSPPCGWPAMTAMYVS